jgi:hypothetical protein
MKKMSYRLLATATAAPNDYIELGTSSEALGHLGYMDVLMRFFKNDQNSVQPTRSRRFERPDKWFGDTGKWRFKGHAEIPFWKWVSSWARALRKPSDFGFEEDLVQQTADSDTEEDRDMEDDMGGVDRY